MRGKKGGETKKKMRSRQVVVVVGTSRSKLTALKVTSVRNPKERRSTRLMLSIHVAP